MGLGMLDSVVSAEPLVVFDANRRVVHLNQPAEALLGVRAADAVGHTCQSVLHGRTADGRASCDAGCRHTGHARRGWPVPPVQLMIQTADGPRPFTVSTIVLIGKDGPLLCRVLRASGSGAGDALAAARTRLTPRQREVLQLLAAGVPARGVARRLGITETTARNHIRAILVELQVHSQLEAVARARNLGIVE